MKENINNNKKRKKMKKYLMTVVAALAAASFTSCSNEMDMFDPISSDKGYISLNVDATAPVSVETRAGENPDWKIKLNNTGDEMTVSQLTGKAFAAKTGNTLTVYNYASMEAALAANSGRGDAYWTGTSDPFDIEAGKTTAVTVECGTAKNAAFSVVFNETFTNVAATGYKVNASMSNRSIDFDASNATTAYYQAGSLTYNLTATVNGKAVSVSKQVDLTAGTNTQLTVKANTNGTISLIIHFTDFTTDTTNEITIDAATGAEVVNP